MKPTLIVRFYRFHQRLFIHNFIRRKFIFVIFRVAVMIVNIDIGIYVREVRIVVRFF